jgi:hypothetical protein
MHEMTKKEAIEMLRSYTTHDYYVYMDDGTLMEVSLTSAVLLLSRMPFSIHGFGGRESAFFGPNEVYTVSDPNRKHYLANLYTTPVFEWN